jgi:hypothetical protein
VPAYFLLPLATATYLALQWFKVRKHRWVTDPEKKLRRLGTVALGATTLALAAAATLPTSASFLAMAAPSVTGIADGLWTALVLALLLAAFIELTDMRSPRSEARREDIDRFVAARYDDDLRRFGSDIRAGAKNGWVSLAVHAILILEQTNRPESWRRLERLYVRLLRRPATQGVAQVWSNWVITDAESVGLCVRIINEATGSNPAAYQSAMDYISPALRQYNDGPEYAGMVLQIAEVLNRRFPADFDYPIRS